MHFNLFHTVEGTGDGDVTDSAIGEFVTPDTSIGTASDVSPSHPSSKDEGASSKYILPSTTV